LLRNRQTKAVRLLFEMPDHKVAEELGIRVDTLRRWKRQKEFRAAMLARSRESQESAERIMSESLSHAASRARDLLASEVDAKKPDLKVVIDLLKCSGILEKAGRSGSPKEDLHSIVSSVVGDNCAENEL
jgi:hypothetical protein